METNISKDPHLLLLALPHLSHFCKTFFEKRKDSCVAVPFQPIIKQINEKKHLNTSTFSWARLNCFWTRLANSPALPVFPSAMAVSRCEISVFSINLWFNFFFHFCGRKFKKEVSAATSLVLGVFASSVECWVSQASFTHNIRTKWPDQAEINLNMFWRRFCAQKCQLVLFICCTRRCGFVSILHMLNSKV